MKAFRYEDPETGVRLEEIPIPEPKHGQALIKVQAAGLCHSDVHIIQGRGHSWIAKRPITLGHEVSGTIVKLGPGPSTVQVGDRVAVAIPSHPVEKASWETAIGLGYDGGYGQFVLGHLEFLVKIPDNVSFEQAAVATDSIATAYHAVAATAGADQSSTVAILGIGGLGMNAVTIAALRGAKVYGIDLNMAKFEEAKRCGASACAATLKEFADVKFDIIIDFVGVTSTVQSAISSVKNGGTVVLVGLGATSVEIRTTSFVTRSITLKASIGASKEDLQEVLNLLSTGHLRPNLIEIPFEDIPKGLQRLDGGEVNGRLFTRPN
ncbi:alcohol dehydrogenase [Lasiodiplodia theobromae]|uniref:Butanediol dehydrogenase n=1 Tax=Lasiodiplodia theobromae TaxID=45133 RepID=A0A5N5D362_9PEZI|nr:alcohol dehydrogenase [Lasiodiplodia theobromae]KAB2572120.1 Butanediol dehydrogenase [Lasiodiplodia theobromae]KAF4536137.1 alcohol dehydrogenase [Lasiodiplodia theobromae]